MRMPSQEKAKGKEREKDTISNGYAANKIGKGLKGL
jgi:hypothetical protein